MSWKNQKRLIFGRSLILLGNSSMPPIAPGTKTRLTGQFRGNFLQLHCGAMSQLRCHVTQPMESMSFAVAGNASNLLWRSTPVENTGDVTGAVYLLLPKYTSTPPKTFWFKFQVQTMVMG